MWDRIRFRIASINPFTAEMVGTAIVLILLGLLSFVGCAPANTDSTNQTNGVAVNCFSETGALTVRDTIALKGRPVFARVYQDDDGITIRDDGTVVAVYTGHCSAKRIDLRRVM